MKLKETSMNNPAPVMTPFDKRVFDSKCSELKADVKLENLQKLKNLDILANFSSSEFGPLAVELLKLIINSLEETKLSRLKPALENNMPLAGGIKPSETIQNLFVTKESMNKNSFVNVIPKSQSESVKKLLNKTNYTEPLRFKEVCSLSHPKGPVSKIKTITGTRLVSGGVDRCVKLWDLPSEKAIINFPGHLDTISDLEFVTQTRQIISSAGHAAHLWDTRNNRCVSTLLSSGVESNQQFKPVYEAFSEIIRKKSSNDGIISMRCIEHFYLLTFG